MSRIRYMCRTRRRHIALIIAFPFVASLLLVNRVYGASEEIEESSCGASTGQQGHCSSHGFGYNKFYQVLAAPPFESMALQLVESFPDRFVYYATHWNKFPDGTDSIQIGGFVPENKLSGRHVLFFASFHDNDVTWSQFQVFIYLLHSTFLESLTIVLPYYPVGTMERVDQEDGTIPTAVTYAHLFSALPRNCAKPTRLITYDLHTLQNRFYFHDNTVASLFTALPLLEQKLRSSSSHIDAVAFPDDGAAKRFGSYFSNLGMLIFRKTRGSRDEAHKRTIELSSGTAHGRHVVIVDDLVQTGGTLYECCKALKAGGALSVSAFVTHAVFPRDSWTRFLGDGEFACLEKFWVTNSVPTTTNKLPEEGVFEVLNLTKLIAVNLDQQSIT